MAKRKLEIKDVRKENQTATSKKHDKKCLENGAKSTEVTLSLQLKVLQGKLDTLEQEKRETEIVVDDLKNQIKVMKETKA